MSSWLGDLLGPSRGRGTRAGVAPDAPEQHNYTGGVAQPPIRGRRPRGGDFKTPAPPLPQDVWDALPAEARALIEVLPGQVQALQAEVATLKARLDANSRNSSRPPSSDPPHVKRRPPRPASKRERGGQPGHRRADTVTTGPVAEVARAIATSPALNGDETGWRQAHQRAWLWTAVGEGMTLLRIDRSRGADALRRLVGEAIAPVSTSDRFPTDKRVPVRQVCWAHLRRDFQAMIDRAAGGKEVGAKLVAFSGRVFDRWRRFGSGAIRRSPLRGYAGWLRPVARLNLEAGRFEGRPAPSPIN